jgi:serine/threonine-protein kinase
LGTPEFMSPEVILGRRQPDAQVDLWALAVVAYYALAGELPFDSKTAREIVLKVVSQPHAPLRELRPDAPRELDEWFDRALSKKVEVRFPSARDLAGAFVRAVDARRPSLRFSHPDPSEIAATLPGYRAAEDSAPAPSSRRPVDSGTMRILEATTPTGTSILPRDESPVPRTTVPVVSEIPPPPPSTPPEVLIPRAPATMRIERKSPLPLIALLAGVSALATLGIMRMTEPGPPVTSNEPAPPPPEPPKPAIAPPAQPTTTVAPETSSSVATPAPSVSQRPTTGKHGF